MLGYGFVDMDRAIEKSRGMSVGEIFSRLGEPEFRRMETDFLKSCDWLAPDTIVAVGGGAACHGNNMDAMNAAGHTVYFRMSPKTLYGRLEKGRGKRPKLAGLSDGELMEFIEKTLAEREQYYARASVTIDCDGVSDAYIAEHLEHYIKSILTDRR